MMEFKEGNGYMTICIDKPLHDGTTFKRLNAKTFKLYFANIAAIKTNR
jgi:hypothetical protein